ncbi:MAG: hypothetical protein A3F67_05395 [Verrucomicrobia bacterium RIFCSPHIGHO2_12_FULL_41_10]|nr:MAG: hypothetical protein A3F67_05395 [Verrucomicrobia bacterium RIFCSPHIGHO2_12_FULL_41_10]HLB33660.1 hypothetical protein [Chthoniobacterales bacterium]
MSASYDPFLLLNLPRRPLVDMDQLDQNFRRLAAVYHPDKSDSSTDATKPFAAEGDFEDKFLQLQEAATLLRNLSTRLRYLGDNSSETSHSFPLEAADFFSLVNATLRQAHDLTSRYHATQGTLAKALLMQELLLSKQELEKTQRLLDSWQESLNTQLRELDEQWPNVDNSKLLDLATSFSFASRWDQQLKDALLNNKTVFSS